MDKGKYAALLTEQLKSSDEIQKKRVAIEEICYDNSVTADKKLTLIKAKLFAFKKETQNSTSTIKEVTDSWSELAINLNASTLDILLLEKVIEVVRQILEPVIKFNELVEKIGEIFRSDKSPDEKVENVKKKSLLKKEVIIFPVYLNKMKRSQPDNEVMNKPSENVNPLKKVFILFNAIGFYAGNQEEEPEIGHQNFGFTTVYNADDKTTSLRKFIRGQIEEIKREYEIDSGYIPQKIIMRCGNRFQGANYFNGESIMSGLFSNENEPSVFLDLFPPPHIRFNQSNDLDLYKDCNELPESDELNNNSRNLEIPKTKESDT